MRRAAACGAARAARRDTPKEAGRPLLPMRISGSPLREVVFLGMGKAQRIGLGDQLNGLTTAYWISKIHGASLTTCWYVL